ncbi:MAG TPA: hypothetical protein VKE74_00640 [Gemmataceae bacterium]|nr:hypothetical protein [Gemmataceae bacterium]
MPDRGWPIRRLLAGAFVGLISGSQTGPVVWGWPRIWPIEWWSGAPGLLGLAMVALIAYAEERGIGRNRR